MTYKSKVREAIEKWKSEKKQGLHTETLREFCEKNGFNYITAKQY